MVAANPNDRIPFVGSNSMPQVNRLAVRIRHYLDQHPELSRERFLLEAVGREIDLREQKETVKGTGPARWERMGINRSSIARPTISAEDIRLHAWLTERLAVVHYERHGLWPKLRRLLFGNRLVRWLGLQPSADRGRERAMAGFAK